MIATKALTETRELKSQLYGHYPPKDDKDVGDIGVLRNDLKALRSTFRFLEGIPGVVIKIVAVAGSLAAIWKVFQ